MTTNKYLKFIFCFLFVWLLINSFNVSAQIRVRNFSVIAFFTAKEDPAHISFVHEANKWFSMQGEKLKFK